MKKIISIFIIAASILLPLSTPAVSSRPGNPVSYLHRTAGHIENSLFEKAVDIIKATETLHCPEHWPLIGYGHKVQPGEPYRRGVRLSETQADALLRKDLKKLCENYSGFGKDAVLLATLAYNCGPRKVNQSSVMKKLKEGNRNIFKAYTSFCRYKGKFHKQLYQRRLSEFAALFIP